VKIFNGFVLLNFELLNDDKSNAIRDIYLKREQICLGLPTKFQASHARMFCNEQAGEDALEVLVGLGRVRRERRPRFRGVRREESGNWSVEARAVEVVCGQGPFRQEHRRYRIAAYRYR
jgi:hypothetical protein